MDGKIKELRRNTLIIAVSNIGSRAILFLLAPLYSYYLTESQYGIMDLITTTVSLLAPFFCLDIYEATFRFAGDREEDGRTIYSSSLLLCLFGVLLGAAATAVSCAAGYMPELVAGTAVFSVLTVINNVLSQFARGSGRIRVFAFSGIVNALILLASNAVFLILLKLELRGWLISYFFAKLFTFLYLAWRTDLPGNFSVRHVSRSCIKRMLRYCIPLMPTAIMWWIMNVSDRYMLSFFLGTAVTGIYAVAGKIPGLLSIFENIFYQAWQTTAINSAGTEDQDRFYSEVLNKYIQLILTGCISLLPFLRWVITLLFSKPFHAAVNPAPILVLCIAIHAVAGNLGAIYTVCKDTRGALYTSFAGAMVNILLNLLFIPKFGMVGAAVTTIIGYTVTLLFRWFDVRKFAKLTPDIGRVLPLLILLAVQFVLYFSPSLRVSLIQILIMAGVLFSRRELVLSLLRR